MPSCFKVNIGLVIEKIHVTAIAFVYLKYIENTSWKVLAYGIYARVVDVSEIERVSAVNE